MAAADNSPSNEARLEKLLAEYLHAAEAGQPLDQQELLDQHPDLADELRSFFANREALERIAEPLKGSAYEPTVGLGESSDTGDATRVRYFGDYELLEELGRGGMGVVYQARQSTLNRLVALKMILSGQLASADDVQRFKQEAEAAANLDHPHIAPIYETGEHEGQQYFSMKLIQGRSLRDALPELRDDVRAGVKLLSQVARAVHHAHQRGVLHRDLKPANVLLDQEGTPYVTDFGLAKRVEGGSDVTKTGAIVGTPSYMSPEQATGEKQLSTAADVYSLGAIHYELLTGQPPFRGDSPLDTLMKSLANEPVRPKTINQTVDRDLETIALKCLEKDTAKRYDSAAALADDLDRWLLGEPILARPSSSFERLSKWTRRRPAVASLVVVTVVATAVLVAVILRSNFRLEQQRNYARQQERLATQERNRAVTARIEADQQRDKAVAARNESDRQRLRAAELLSQAQAEQGARLLDQQNPRGLLNLLEARRTVDGEQEPAAARTLLWSAWYTQYARRLQQVLAGNGIRQVVFSPDGRTLASQGPGNLIRFWDPATGQTGPSFGTAGENIPGLGRAVPIAFAADGRSLMTFDDQASEAQLWDIPTRKPVGTPVAFGSGDSVTAWVSPDTKWMAKRADARSIQLCEWRTGKPIGEKVTPPGNVEVVAISPDGQSIVTLGDRVQLWNVASGEARGPASKLSGNRPMHAVFGLRRDLVFSLDGKWYAAVSERNFDSFVQLFDAATGQPRGEAWQPAGSHMPGAVVERIKFSPDGSLLATMSTESLQLWETATGKLRGQPLHAESGLINLAFSPDNRWLAAASSDGCAELWTTATGQPYGMPLWHRDPVAEVVFSPDSRLLATVAGGAARLWRTELDEPCGPTVLERDTVGGAAISPDGKVLASSEGTAVRLWDAADGKPFRAPLEQTRLGGFIAFSDDGRYLAAALEGGVQLWDAKNWMRLDKPFVCSEEIEGLTLSSDGQWVAALVRDGLFRVWNTATGKPYEPPIRQEPMESAFFDPLFTPNGKLLVARGSFGMVVVDLLEGQRIEPSLKPTDERGEQAIPWAMSSDGRWIVKWTEGEIRLQDVRTDSDGAVIAAPSLFFQVVFNAECDAVATAFEDGTVRVWDAATRKTLGPVLSTPRGMPQIVFRPGGKQLATLSSDATDPRLGLGGGTIRLWDIATGLQLGPPRQHAGQFTKISFSPDGNRLLAVSMTEKLRLWSMPSAALSLREIELRTWLALGMRLDAQGVWEALPGDEWQELKRQLEPANKDHVK